MKRSLTIRLLTCIVLFSSACSSSKFDYNTAYKFSTYKYQKSSSLETPLEPIASLEPMTTPRSHIPSDRAIRQQTAERVISDFQENYAKASKQEKKAMRKDIKAQLKQVRQDMKAAKKDSQQQDVHFNKKMYVGVVVLLAGIVVAILASGTVGALAIIVGVALIAWGFIEQA